jgi:protease I
MRLAGLTIGMFVAEGVEDFEYWVTRMRLEEEGASILAIGADLAPARGKNGLPVKADVVAPEVDPAGLFALVIPGGWAPDKLRRYPAVLGITRHCQAEGKVIGIICHGGSIAISAGIVAGRRCTGSLGIKDDLALAGGVFVDEPALVDGNQVWGRVVADIPAFNRLLVAELARRAGAP